MTQQRGGLYDRYENWNVKDHYKSRRKVARNYNSMEHSNDEFLHNRTRINNSALIIQGNELVENQQDFKQGNNIEKK